MTHDFAAFSAELDENGFFVWHDLVASDAVDAHVVAIESGLPLGRPGNVSADPVRLAEHRATRARFYERDETFLDICLNDKIVAFARYRFGGEPALKTFGAHRWSMGSHIHADNVNSAASDPWENDIRVWCALEDIDPRSGPMYLYPESHKLVSGNIREEFLERYPQYLPMLEEWPVHKNLRSDWYKQLTALTQELVDQLGLQKAIPPLRKGDAIIFNGATIHGTTAPDDLALTRKAMIFNIFKADSSFYSSHAYWGRHHDWRLPGNELIYKTKKTRRGLVVDEYMPTLEAYEERPLTRPVSG